VVLDVVKNDIANAAKAPNRKHFQLNLHQSEHFGKNIIANKNLAVSNYL